ncbi:hypothetical protein ACLI1A_11590 [Flavobacterium sp. RHBU_3]|uniref:hypothetical protein n=1 Tax=Flavobacterium sp. RHBU_3 TaxID=3391184 RepID=UPI0039851988
MNAEVENKPKKAVQKRRQDMAAPYALHEAESSVALKQAPALQKNELSGEAITAVPENTTIPAVHGSGSVYAAGSELKHKELQESLDKTGDLSHPETQKKEQDYKSSLSIPELREYNDIKSGAVAGTAQSAAGGVEQSSTDAVGATNTDAALKDVAKPDTETGSAEVPAGEAANGANVDAPGKDGLRYLDASETEGELKNKLQETTVLANSNSKTKSAEEKINESVKAQNTPVSEAQSDSNSGQVRQLAKKNFPQKNKQVAAKVLDNAIKNAAPKTLKDIDEFKESKKGDLLSKSIMNQVSADVNSVKSGFGSINTKPAPAPAAKGAALPGAEAAKPVKALNLSKGILPTVKSEAIDNKKYVDESEQLLEKQGITKEQLNMVDSGDLAQAKIARESLHADAASETNEVKEVASKENKKLSTELNTAETKSRTEMQNERSQQLKQTGAKQVKAKSDLEKKRDEVAKNINDKYTTCQQSITNKLNNLEKKSLSDFDKGQKLATQEFEERVERDKEAFKSKRYTFSLKGAYYWSRDLFKGIDNLPEIKKIFDEARKSYVNKIDALIDTITKRNNEVIAECKNQLENTRKEIDNYVKTLAPSLKDIGKKAQADVNQKLQQLDKEINSRKEKLQKQLVEKRKAAMKAIDDKIAKMKAKMKGLISVMGKLIADAAKKFFKWALELVGMDAESFFKMLERAGQAIKAIFDDPGKFFTNLVAAVKGSINDFTANFKKYLTEALFDWLMGAVGAVVTLPEKWDLKGILSVVLQLAGISWAFIRKKLVDNFGEEKVAFAEQRVQEVKEIVTRFMNDGIMGVWEWIKEQADMIKTTVIEGIKDWLLTKLVVGFAEWIVSLLIPGGGVIKLIQGIYKLVMWFVDNISRIMRWVNAIMGSIGNIALSDIPAAIGFIVEAMKTMIPVILDFFAKLLNINGIIDAVQGVIDRIMDPIHKAINKAVEWISNLIKKLVKKFKGGGAAAGEEQPQEAQNHEHLDDAEVGKTVRFSADGENHRLWIDTAGSGVEVMVASTPMTVKERLAKWRGKLDEVPEDTRAHAKTLLNTADTEYHDLLGEARISDHDIKKAKEADVTEQEIKEAEKQDNIVEKKASQISSTLKELFDIFGQEDEGSLPDSIIKHIQTSLGGGVMGKSMVASPLTRNGIEGSEPKQMNKVYENLFYRKEGKRSYYVRGHLLNENLHGEGILANLTPLSQTGNKNHLRAAEEPIKIAVLGGAIVDYIMIVEYGRSVPDVSDEQLDAAGFESNEDKVKVRKIREAEQFVPQGISLKSNYLKKEGDRYVKDKVLLNKNSIINPVDLDLKNYKIDSDRKVHVSIKFDTPAEIADNSSLTPYQANIMHQAANLVGNLTEFKQIIPKLSIVSTDLITIAILTEKIKNKDLGGKLRIKKVYD